MSNQLNLISPVKYITDLFLSTIIDIREIIYNIILLINCIRKWH